MDRFLEGGEDVFQSTQTLKRRFQAKGVENTMDLTRKLPQERKPDPFETPGIS